MNVCMYVCMYHMYVQIILNASPELIDFVRNPLPLTNGTIGDCDSSSFVWFVNRETVLIHLSSYRNKIYLGSIIILYVCMYISYVCMYVCMYHVYVCMYIYMYVCMYVCMLHEKTFHKKTFHKKTPCYVCYGMFVCICM